MFSVKQLLVLFFILPIKVNAQSIAGLYQGTLYNDTTQLYYKYEIAISDDDGKLSGFSHTWFILNDQQYYGVKKVNVKKVDGKIIIEDEELLANNYPVKPAKNVRQLNILTLSADGKTLSGPFTTNATKRYRPLTGFIKIEKVLNYQQTALVPHLQELGYNQNLSFVKEDQAKEKMMAIATIEKIKQQEAQKKAMETALKNEAAIANTKPPQEQLQKQTPKNIPQEQTSLQQKTEKAEAKKQQQAEAEKTKALKAQQLAEQIKAQQEAQVAQQALLEKKKNTPAADVANRINVLQQTVTFTTDSLQLSLYDNGEVDGDTVTVILNGEVIIAKQRLSTNAVKKTIYIPAGTNKIELIMYAESMGSIPPNTGLLMIRDGKKLYEVRFSGDLQKNASIIFTRKTTLP